MVAKSGGQKWPPKVAAKSDPKSGGQKWPPKVVAKSGPQKWRLKVAPKSGDNNWPQKVAAKSGEQKWWPKVAAKSGATSSNLYQFFYPHRSRELVSPVCGIFFSFFMKKIFFFEILVRRKTLMVYPANNILIIQP